MKKSPIYLDQEGYKNFLDSIDEIKKMIKANDAARFDAFNAGAGDGWDSPEFEEIERIANRLAGELEKKYDELKRIVIIERQSDTSIIDIGDVILTDIEYEKGDIEELAFKLVGSSGNPIAELAEISINSPLGAAVYKRKVGDNCFYSVNGKKISVLIKEKLDLTKEEDLPLRK